MTDRTSGKLRRRRPARRGRVRAGSTTSSPTACSTGARDGLVAPRRRRRRRHRGVGAGRVRAPARGQAPRRARARSTRSSASARDPGRHRATSSTWPASARAGIQQAAARHRRARSCSACSPPRPRPGARAGRARRPATRASRPRRPRSRWPTCCVSCPKGRVTGSRPHAEARPAQGLAREGHARAVRGGRPRGQRARPTSTTRRRSTIPASTRCASCARRRSRSYVAEGLFDLGITGRDWIEETGSDVVVARRAALLEGDRPTRPHRRRGRRRLAGRAGRGPAAGRAGRPPSTPSSPGASSRRRASTPTSGSRYGATEAKVPDIVDCIVEITETGRALRAAGPQDHRHDPHVATPS